MDETIILLRKENTDLKAAHAAEMRAKDVAHQAQIDGLMALVAELQAQIAKMQKKLDQPKKTPANSSVPPSSGQKANGDGASAARRKSHPGAHRPLHPNPTSYRDMFATRCACGAILSPDGQVACDAYDHVELPKVEPVVTRVTLYTCTCPNCEKKCKAEPPEDMPHGSPFGPNLRALVFYQRFLNGVSLQRLTWWLADQFNLSISEGALVNMLQAARTSFDKQSERICAAILAADTIESDETTMRVGKKNWWMWVFHHGLYAFFLAKPSRAKSVVDEFLDGAEPDFWVSDRYGGQMCWGIFHQVCLAHFIRDARYAVEKGDAVFAPKLIVLLKTACAIGRRRDKLAASTLKTYAYRLDKKLDALMALDAPSEAGKNLQKIVKKVRRHLFVFVTRLHIPPTNNGSERALRPCAIYRKITNGFRSEWGVKLYADIRSVMETARRHNINILEAIRLTLAGDLLPLGGKADTAPA
jgi:transposase